MPRGGRGVRRRRVVYATKAFLCRAMARLAARGGACSSTWRAAASCTSPWRAGVPAIGVHDARQQQERRRAARGDRRRRAPHRRRQLRRARPPRRAPRRRALRCRDVLLRITPGVHAHTHEYIATGQDDSKFGFNLATATPPRAVERARRSPSVQLVGLHCHIGIQRVRRRQLRRGGAEVMAAFAAPLRPARARRSAAGSAWPTSRARRRRRSPNGPTAVRRRPAAAAGVAVGGQRRAGAGDRRRRRRSRSTPSARSSRSPACAPTSPSTAG